MSCPAGCNPQPAVGKIPHDLMTGVSAITELLLTAIVLLLGRDWKGIGRGSSLEPRVCILALYSSTLLLLVAVWNAAFVVYRLVRFPEAVGNKDELGITAAAFAALWYTDVMRLRPSVRRRRRVSELLACFPTFRFGSAGRESPSVRFSEAEFVIRSAHWSLRTVRPQPDYWRGRVAFAGSSSDRCKSLVVLHDPTAQDEQGAELLTPNFTHAPELTKQAVADVVWAAVVRAGLWNVHGWDPGCTLRAVGVLGEDRAVQGIRSGELWRRVPNTDNPVAGSGAGRDGRMSEAEAKELCEVVWAAATLEAVEYLERGRRMALLPAIVDVPLAIQQAESAEWPAGAMLELACQSFVDDRR